MNGLLNLDNSTSEPVNRLVLTIINNAIKLGANTILLELDLELHLQTQKEAEVIREKYRRPSFYEAIFKNRFKDFFSYGKPTVEKMFFEIGKLPTALNVIYVIRGVWETMPSVYGELFGEIIRCLQANRIACKTNGEFSTVIETQQPISKWQIESKDLTRQIQFQKI